MRSFLIKNWLLLSIIVLAFCLRFYNLASVPPSLYWDEASLGYNAYSILKTGHDEHQKFLPLTNFAAYGDYKPPLYIYATVPSIAIFGLNEFSIRFPSALFGSLTVVLTYFLTRKLFPDGPRFKFRGLNVDVPLLATLFLAISPWHLQFSRGAFEANLGLFFSTLGIYLFFKFAQGSQFWILPAMLSFMAGMYTFTGQRLFVPFILIILFVQFRKRLIKSWLFVSLSIFIFGLIFYPLYVFSTKTIEGILRFDEVTIFKDLAPINKSIDDRQLEGFSPWANIIHNRRFYVGAQYLAHYLDAFNPKFLVTSGDVNPRLSIQKVGELYYLEAMMAVFGLYFLLRHKEKYRWFLILWLLASPLGPATARETPHALRMIHILPTFQILASYGLLSLYQAIRYKKTFFTIIAMGIIVNFALYLHLYYFHYPQVYAGEWQYGYKQAVLEANKIYDDVDQIVVTKALGRPYIYFLLYGKVKPQDYWRSAKVERDKFFFYDVKSFGKYTFSDDVLSAPVHGKVVYIATYAPNTSALIKEIKDPLGKAVLFVTKKQ